jgi:hypothetical protein
MEKNTNPYLFNMRKDMTVGFGDAGYYLRLWTQRDGTMLELHHDTKILSPYNTPIDPNSRVLCTCSKSHRPLAEVEKNKTPDICPNVILWQVDWKDSYDLREIEGVGNLRKFLKSFFEFWQNAGGIGCWIDGVQRDARVEVSFGGASFNLGR